MYFLRSVESRAQKQRRNTNTFILEIYMTWQLKESLLYMLLETEIVATATCISVTKL